MVLVAGSEFEDRIKIGDRKNSIDIEDKAFLLASLICLMIARSKKGTRRSGEEVSFLLRSRNDEFSAHAFESLKVP